LRVMRGPQHRRRPPAFGEGYWGNDLEVFREVRCGLGVHAVDLVALEDDGGRVVEGRVPLHEHERLPHDHLVAVQAVRDRLAPLRRRPCLDQRRWEGGTERCTRMPCLGGFAPQPRQPHAQQETARDTLDRTRLRPLTLCANVLRSNQKKRIATSRMTGTCGTENANVCPSSAKHPMRPCAPRAHPAQPRSSRQPAGLATAPHTGGRATWPTEGQGEERGVEATTRSTVGRTLGGRGGATWSLAWS